METVRDAFNEINELRKQFSGVSFEKEIFGDMQGEEEKLEKKMKEIRKRFEEILDIELKL